MRPIALAGLATLALGGVSFAHPFARPSAGGSGSGSSEQVSTIATANAACIACHADAAREWNASLHRAAFTDGSFAHGYAIEPSAFCRDCHAPEARNGAGAAWAEAHGVACTSCHGTPESGDRHSASPRETANQSCAGCHEFVFEGAALPPERSRLMQLTLTEHAASPARDQSCASCHMRGGDHRFDVSRNAELLRASLDVEIALATEPPLGKRVAIVRLRPKGVGHAFPTGDMFRRLVVRAEILGAGERVLEQRERSFGRTFAIGGSVKRTSTDTRLTGPAEARFGLGALGRGRGHRPSVRIRVIYQRRLTVRPSLDPMRVETNDGRLEDEIVLAERALSGTDQGVARAVSGFGSSQ